MLGLCLMRCSVKTDRHNDVTPTYNAAPTRANDPQLVKAVGTVDVYVYKR
jgi:hypothetical protein